MQDGEEIWEKWVQIHTSKKVILQASSRHKLIDK